MAKKNTRKKVKKTESTSEIKNSKINESSHKKDNVQENHIDKKYNALLVPSRKNSSFFVTSFFTDKGDNTNHNNHFTYQEMNEYGIWLIFDGNNGGDFQNEIAPMAGEMVLEEFAKHPTMDAKYIKEMLLQINKRIILLQKEKYQEMKQYSYCSFVIMISDYSRVLFANVGTSRGLLIRDHKIIHRTCDDSLAHLMYERGSIFYDEIRFRKDKNALTQKFGLDSKININFSEVITLLPNDKAILLSMGAWENLDEEDIITELNNNVRCGHWISGVIRKIRGNNSYFLNNFTLCGVYFNRPIPYIKAPNFFERLSKDFNAAIEEHYKKALLLLLLFLLLFGGKKYYDTYKLNKEIDNYTVQIKKNIELGDGKMTVQSFDDSVPLYNNALDIYDKLKPIAKEDASYLVSKVDYKIDQSEIGSQVLKTIKEGNSVFEADQYGLAKVKYQNAQKLLDKFTIENTLKSKTPKELEKKIEVSRILEEAYTKKLEADDMYEKPGQKRKAIATYKGIAPIFDEHKRIKIYEEIMSKLNIKEEHPKPQPKKEEPRKEDTTNYIALGDQAFNRGEYTKSLSLYKKALQNKRHNDTNTAQGKINMNNIVLNGSLHESSGDSMLERKENNGAIGKYNAAIGEYRKLRGNRYLPGGVDRLIKRTEGKLNRIKNEK